MSIRKLRCCERVELVHKLSWLRHEGRVTWIIQTDREGELGLFDSYHSYTESVDVITRSQTILIVISWSEIPDDLSLLI